MPIGGTSLNSTSEKRELRKLSLVLGFVLLAFGLFPLVRGNEVRWWLVGPAACVWLVGLVLPSVLAPLSKVLIAVGHVIGRVNSSIILTAVYVIVLTPIGLVRKIFVRGNNKYAFKTGAQSYWLKKDAVDVKEGMRVQF